MHPVELGHVLVNTAKYNMARAAIAIQVVLYLLNSNFDRQFGRVVVDPAADRGKRYGMVIFSSRLGQAMAVTTGQQLGLAQITAPPYRADRVVDTLNRKAETGRGAQFPDGTTAEKTAGLQELWTCRPMNSAIDATAAKEPLVGCIDDYINMQPSDITEVYFDHSIYSNRGTTVLMRRNTRRAVNVLPRLPQ